MKLHAQSAQHDHILLEVWESNYLAIFDFSQSMKNMLNKNKFFECDVFLKQ